MNKTYKLNHTGYLKKLAALVLASSLAAVGTVATLPGNTPVVQAAAANNSMAKSAIYIQVEGKAIQGQGLTSTTGKLMVPLKEVAKAMGASITYDAKTHDITVKKQKVAAKYNVYSQTKGNKVTADAQDGAYVYFNGGATGDSYDGQVIKGVAYVQVQAVSELFGYRSVWNHATHTVNLTQAAMNNVTITPTSLKGNIDHKPTTLNILYPVVSGLDNLEAQASINKALKAYFDDLITSAQTYAKEINTDASLTELKKTPFEIDGGYKVTYNQNGVISFMLTDYVYLGGAHGDTSPEGMTFSLQDGKLLKLDDLLKSNTNYRQDLKKLLQADIRKHADDMGVSLEQFNDRYKNSSTYLDNFYLNDSGFDVFFQTYDISPGAAGNPKFSYTFNQLLKSGSNPFGFIQ
ncbi:PdaC/SigV domain-containing protein [Paenibacillus kandeliae]|uniref:PdaC/SigV domain-containing protein n=1 Tax=Paenibacillus kandeliae TaxID=3231269 RepID=UPI00345A2AEB